MPAKGQYHDLASVVSVDLCNHVVIENLCVINEDVFSVRKWQVMHDYHRYSAAAFFATKPMQTFFTDPHL